MIAMAILLAFGILLFLFTNLAWHLRVLHRRCRDEHKARVEFERLRKEILEQR